jgi:hypothetical protein
MANTDRTLSSPAQVNCLQLGRKSVNVLVTGDSDNKVNLYSNNNTSPLLSLLHSAAVQSVALDWPEELVLESNSGRSWFVKRHFETMGSRAI